MSIERRGDGWWVSAPTTPTVLEWGPYAVHADAAAVYERVCRELRAQGKLAAPTVIAPPRTRQSTLFPDPA